MRNYKNPVKPTWANVTIRKKLGCKTYDCEPTDRNGLSIKRPIDQLLKERNFYNKYVKNLHTTQDETGKADITNLVQLPLVSESPSHRGHILWCL